MIHYPHIDVAGDDPVLIEDDSVATYWCCRRWSSTHDDSIFTYGGYRRWSSILILRLMMKMHDVVPKLPMTYRDSIASFTFVLKVVFDVEYLPS